MVLLSVQQGLDHVRTHMANARVYVNFEKCLKTINGGQFCNEEEDLLQLFVGIAQTPEQFKQRSNFPATWKSDNSIIAGVSSISQALETPAIKAALSPHVYQTAKRNLVGYIRELKGDTAVEDTTSLPPGKITRQDVQVIKEEHPADGCVEEEEEADDSQVTHVLLMMLQEARNIITEKNNTIQRLVQEVRDKEKGSASLPKDVTELQRKLKRTHEKLDICVTYIKKVASERDAAMLEAFMTLLELT